MRQSFRLVHPTARQLARAAVETAPHGYIVEVREQTRSLDQNARFHAICSDVAKFGVTWAGRARTAEQWKVLFVSAHAVATGRGSEVVPGLEGEFVNLRESTAQMGKSRASSLMEYVQAWCAEHEIELKETVAHGL